MMRCRVTIRQPGLPPRGSANSGIRYRPDAVSGIRRAQPSLQGSARTACRANNRGCARRRPSQGAGSARAGKRLRRRHTASGSRPARRCCSITRHSPGAAPGLHESMPPIHPTDQGGAASWRAAVAIQCRSGRASPPCRNDAPLLQTGPAAKGPGQAPARALALRRQNHLLADQANRGGGGRRHAWVAGLRRAGTPPQLRQHGLGLAA